MVNWFQEPRTGKSFWVREYLEQKWFFRGEEAAGIVFNCSLSKGRNKEFSFPAAKTKDAMLLKVD